MQNPINTQDFVLLSIPRDLLDEIGAYEGGTLQMFTVGCRLVIEPLDDEEDYVCDGNCESCPTNTNCEKDEVH